MAGTEKMPMHNLSKAEQRKYFLQEIERAKKVPQEKTERGDERGAMRAAEIIDNLQNSISRLEH